MCLFGTPKFCVLFSFMKMWTHLLNLNLGRKKKTHFHLCLCFWIHVLRTKTKNTAFGFWFLFLEKKKHFLTHTRVVIRVDWLEQERRQIKIDERPVWEKWETERYKSNFVKDFNELYSARKSRLIIKVYWQQSMSWVREVSGHSGESH